MRLRVKGIESASRAINRELKKVNVQSENALILIKMAIEANTLPYVPVDTSNLINSRYTVGPSKTNDGYSMLYGFGGDKAGARGTPVSKYSVYVHEGPQKRWQKPGASNKYLLKGLQDAMKSDIPRVIRYLGGKGGL